jgi:hypothetical protein
MLAMPGLLTYAGFGSIAHKVPKKPTVGAQDGHRNVVAKPVLGGRVMVAELRVFFDVVDIDGWASRPDLVADRRCDVELAAGLQSEMDFVAGGAGNPTVLRDPGNGGKTHTRRAADHIEDYGNSFNSADRVQACPIVLLHCPCMAATSRSS